MDNDKIVRGLIVAILMSWDCYKSSSYGSYHEFVRDNFKGKIPLIKGIRAFARVTGMFDYDLRTVKMAVERHVVTCPCPHGCNQVTVPMP